MSRSDALPRAVDDVAGTVYLLHFEWPYAHAQHYTGWPRDLEQRLHEHRHGLRHAGRLPQVFHAAGIGFVLAATWPGGRTFERQLKRRGGARRHCPVCREAARG